MQFNQSTDTWVEGSVSDTRPADAVDDPALADSITLDISDPAHRTEAFQAAANVLAGINKLRAYFASVDQNLSFPFDGKMMRAGDILDLVNQTKFVITDKPFDNGGVGSAIRMVDGTTVDTLNYEFFDGDNGDYASPLYSNMEGMVGILLHEMGHMTADGKAFDTRSHHYFLQEQQRAHDFSQSYANSIYWSNNESYANSFAQTVAGAIGADINEWNPTDGFYYDQPEYIFSAQW